MITLCIEFFPNYWAYQWFTFVNHFFPHYLPHSYIGNQQPVTTMHCCMSEFLNTEVIPPAWKATEAHPVTFKQLIHIKLWEEKKKKLKVFTTNSLFDLNHDKDYIQHFRTVVKNTEKKLEESKQELMLSQQVSMARSTWPAERNSVELEGICKTLRLAYF